MHLELSEKEAKALCTFLGALNEYDILAALTRIDDYTEDMGCETDIVLMYARLSGELKNPK